jgi:hypothetical protein
MFAELGGEQQKVQMFCLRSMASAGAFHRAYPYASQQAFLEGHELARRSDLSASFTSTTYNAPADTALHRITGLAPNTGFPSIHAC